jgi:hypothetical protein
MEEDKWRITEPTNDYVRAVACPQPYLLFICISFKNSISFNLRIPWKMPKEYG